MFYTYLSNMYSQVTGFLGLKTLCKFLSKAVNSLRRNHTFSPYYIPFKPLNDEFDKNNKNISEPTTPVVKN
jgi:hypothetical protein